MCAYTMIRILHSRRETAMSKWLDLKINVEIQVSPITDNEKETKYKLDLTISAIIVLSVSKLIPLPVK